MPSEYQEVEYIESSGTQYIRLDGRTYNNEKYYIKVQNVGGTNQSIFLTQSYIFNLYFQNNMICEENNIRLINPPNQTQVGNNIVEVEAIQKAQNISRRLTLFNTGSVRVWYCRVEINNEPYRDLVPCYRKSDNEIGMYDLVNDIFYTNAGTGTFTKGPEV